MHLAPEAADSADIFTLKKISGNMIGGVLFNLMEERYF